MLSKSIFQNLTKNWSDETMANIGEGKSRRNLRDQARYHSDKCVETTDGSKVPSDYHLLGLKRFYMDPECVDFKDDPYLKKNPTFGLNGDLRSLTDVKALFLGMVQNKC